MYQHIYIRVNDKESFIWYIALFMRYTAPVAYTLGYKANYLACTTKTDTLSFSFDATDNGTGNSCLTLALIVKGNVMLQGTGHMTGQVMLVRSQLSDNLTANGYIMATTGANTGTANL